MTDPHPFTEVMEKAAQIVTLMLPAAVRGTDALIEEAEKPSGSQIRATAMLLMLLHRDRTRETGLNATIDDPLIDELHAAADAGMTKLRDAVLALDDPSARATVVELLSLYRDLIVVEVQARTAAQTN